MHPGRIEAITGIKPSGDMKNSMAQGWVYQVFDKLAKGKRPGAYVPSKEVDGIVMYIYPSGEAEMIGFDFSPPDKFEEKYRERLENTPIIGENLIDVPSVERIVYTFQPKARGIPFNGRFRT